MRLVLFVLLTSSLVTAQTAESTANYLRKLAVADGGYRPTVPTEQSSPPPTLASTSAGMRAEKMLTGQIPNRDKHARFIRSCFDQQSGGFGPSPGKPADVPSTAIGLMATAEVGVDDRELMARAVNYLASNAKSFEERRIAAGGFEAVQIVPEVSKAWIEEIRKTANPDGSFGEGATLGRTTGGVVAFVLRQGGSFTPEQRKGFLHVLRAAQQADGAFIGADGKSTDLESSYRIMRAFYLLGERPGNVAQLKHYLDSCRNPDGGYGRKPGEASSGSGTYYYASISKWIKSLDSK